MQPDQYDTTSEPLHQPPRKLVDGQRIIKPLDSRLEPPGPVTPTATSNQLASAQPNQPSAYATDSVEKTSSKVNLPDNLRAGRLSLIDRARKIFNSNKKASIVAVIICVMLLLSGSFIYASNNINRSGSSAVHKSKTSRSPTTVSQHANASALSHSTQSGEQQYTGPIDSALTQPLNDFTSFFAAQAQALDISSNPPALTKTCLDTHTTTASGFEVYVCSVTFSNTDAYNKAPNSYTFAATTDIKQAEALTQAYVKVTLSQGFTNDITHNDQLPQCDMYANNTSPGSITCVANYQYRASNTNNSCSTGIDYSSETPLDNNQNITYQLICNEVTMGVPPGFIVVAVSNGNNN